MTRPRCPGQDTRFWRPGDIFEISCPHCGVQMEFFKDDPVLTCRSCRHEVRNPKLDLGCAKWCKYAEQCLAPVRDDSRQVGSLCQRIADRMKSYFGQDQRRIDHCLSVLRYAEQIMESQPDVSGLVVRAAAILHDIGIPEAKRKHGSSAPQYQELEGPPIAREMLEGLQVDPPIIDHVCRIIASHHSAKDIDTPEFRIVYDADWLVNTPDTLEDADKASISKLIDSRFKTEKAKEIARTLFIERNQK